MRKPKIPYPENAADRAYRLSLLGLRGQDLAVAFGVKESTIDRWKEKYESFATAIRRGTQEADGHVAQSLYRRATGFSYPDIHISNFKGEITVTNVTKHYPPETLACIFWLKNRQREQWRDVQSREVTGKDGMPLAHNVKLDLGDFTDSELAMIERAGIKLSSGGNGKVKK